MVLLSGKSTGLRYRASVEPSISKVLPGLARFPVGRGLHVPEPLASPPGTSSEYYVPYCVYSGFSSTIRRSTNTNGKLSEN